LTGDDCETQIVKDECDFPNNSLNIHPKGECEFKDSYNIGSKIEFELTTIDKYGFKSKLSVATKCGVNENDEVALYVKSQSTLFIENDGLATITCVDGDFKTTEIIKTTNFDGGTLDAVIVIGKDKDDDPLKNTFSKSGEKIYRFLYSQGYRDENIHYFNSVDSEQKLVDIDGDGEKDNVVDYHSYTSEDIESKGLDKIGDSKNPLLFYIVDHGSDGGSILLNGETSIYLSLYNLKVMLNNFYKKTGREQIVVIDTCYSGIFVDGLKDDYRVVYGSASATQTIPMDINGINFTHYFLQRLARKYTLNESFEYATEKYKNKFQNSFPEPQSSGGNLTIANSFLGYIFTASVDSIKDFYGKDSDTIDIDTKTLYLSVNDNVLSESTLRVYAYITPPQIIDIQESDNVVAVTSEEIELKYNSSKERFETDYNFNKDGIYQINYELIDGAGDTSNEEITIKVGNSEKSIEFIDTEEISDNITLNSGWNLTSLPTTDIDNHKLIWGYDNSSKRWEVISNDNNI
ncbi:MAG: C13 family peptidase, partial [Campylobacterota bacterium]|nr:C13 family peptidase [Campylobacterota bacterium]